MTDLSGFSFTQCSEDFATSNEMNTEAARKASIGSWGSTEGEECTKEALSALQGLFNVDTLTLVKGWNYNE